MADLSTPVPISERLLLDEQSAAELLSIGVTTLHKLPIPRLTVPGTRLVRYRRIDLEHFVRTMTDAHLKAA